MYVYICSQITAASDWPRLFCTLGVLFSIIIIDSKSNRNNVVALLCYSYVYTLCFFYYTSFMQPTHDSLVCVLIKSCRHNIDRAIVMSIVCKPSLNEANAVKLL